MRTLFLLACFVLVPTLVWSQSTRLVSDLDADLSIQTVVAAPFVDNVSGIYSKSLSPLLYATINEDRQWELLPWPNLRNASPEFYEDSAEEVKGLLQEVGANALITGRISRGPGGVNIKLNLFAGREGLLLAQETLSNFQGFETAELADQVRQMYFKLKSKLPYGGVVLSRRGQLVTINVGTRHGVQAGSDVSVVQILRISRHPKFNFITQADKEILGRIRIQKAEESLSFGLIELERTENLIQPGMKLEPVRFVDYPVGTEMKPPANTDYIYGEDAKEWVPKKTPTFGKASMLLGLGSYSVNNTLSSVGAVNSTQAITPSIHLLGEMWLTSTWFAQLELRQYVFQLKNDYPGSDPSRLSGTSTQTSLVAGYNFLTSQDFFGPKFYVAGGFGRLSSTIDTSSPLAFTSINMSGFKLMVGGEFDLSEGSAYALGARLNYFLMPTLSENPVSSGNGNAPSIASFMGYGIYRQSPTLNYRGELIYEVHSATFSGAGTRGADSASSLSHSNTTLAFGVEVLF